MAVAAHARVRRQAARRVRQPRLDDAGAELVAQVEREVRQAHAVRERAGAAHGVGRAARALAVVLGVAPELERHGDDLAPSRAVSSAATALSTPPLIATSVRSVAARSRRRARGRGAERAVQRVGGEVGRVELADAQPAELGGDRRAVDAGRLQQRRACDELDRRARRGDRRAAARGLESGVADPVVLDRDRRWTRSPHAAPPATPECPPGGSCARPRGLAQVFCESLVRHSQSSMRVSLSGRDPFHPMMGAQ